jgi:beta-xylosidase
MDQGDTNINGPHQGAWVQTQTGEDWFIHFQDKEAYGRVVHLQPMVWKKDWPVIGADPDGNGKGEPVMKFRMPSVGKKYAIQTPPDSDEFNAPVVGKQWQWMADPEATWAFLNPAKGLLRLFSVNDRDAENLWQAPNVLLQKFPAEEFVVTTKMQFHPDKKLNGERAGLVVMGESYAGIALKNTEDGNELVFLSCENASKAIRENEKLLIKTKQEELFLRVKVNRNAKCIFSYSLDGKNFNDSGVFTAVPGKWKGAKIGLFCSRSGQTNDAGYADFDWFRVEAVK